MANVFETTLPAAPATRRKSILPLVYTAGFAASYWSSFIWFYLRDRWNSNASENLFMNAGFGFTYTAGCFAAIWVCRHVSARMMLIVGYACLIALTILSGFATRGWEIGAIILAHAAIITWTWPNLEMLAATGLSSQDLGSALSRYNNGWAFSAACSYAVAGWLYKQNHLTLFVIPTLFFATALVYVAAYVPSKAYPISPAVEPEDSIDDDVTENPGLADLLRTLSRMGNFGCYVLISTMIPMMPFITQRLGLETGEATAFGAIWMLARVSAFFLLGQWHGWHFRLGIFLVSVLCLTVSFAVIVLSGSVILVGISQVVLGLSVGMIYTSALFYSMHGQAETGEAAFHEAVIGLGIMLGPLLGATAGRIADSAGWNSTYATTGAVVLLMGALTTLMLWKTARRFG